VLVKLTKTKVEDGALVPAKGSALYWDSQLHGFGLRVTAKGARSYIVQARVGGRSRRVTLGRHGVLTAEEARKKARKTLGTMADGVDPVAEKRRQAAASVTLREVADDYLDNRRRRDGKPLAERTKADVRRHLRKSFSDWADKPLVEITREGVQKRYRALGKRSQAQANQAMRVLSALFNYARAIHKGPNGENIIPDNPVDVIHDSNTFMGEVQAKDQRVPKDKIGAFYSALESTRTDPAASISIRTKAAAAVVLMLTGLRRADVLERTWADVDLEAGTLHVPDSKHREPRTFPLAREAVAVLQAQREISAGRYVFQSDGGPGPVHDVDAAIRVAAKAVGIHVSTHDLRRTYIDVTEELEIDPLVSELLSNRKGAAYQALATRNKHYSSGDLTRYTDHAQRTADYFERARLAHEGDNVVAIGEAMQ